MRKLRLRTLEFKIGVVFLLAKCFGRFFPSHHWVLLERGYDARDNGYWMYEYIKRKHPQKKVFYIIDKKSADYEKVREDAIQIGSVKSYWCLATADKIVSSHYAVGFPIVIPKLFQFLKLHEKYYFLQHGVIKDDLLALHGDCSPMKLFVCGAKPEYDYVNEVYGHPAGVVRYTGLARFDQLHDVCTREQIVVMPTWRAYIQNQDGFLQSRYYKAWQGLLSNKTLISALEEQGIQLIFYVHYEMQKYAKYFMTNSPNVVIARFEDYDVQTLLKESKLLITDYSSVFFDFAYMRKPVVYYQFDEHEFFGKHYQKGYFDYRSMGFGTVCSHESDVVTSILDIMKNDMQLDEYFSKRINSFFPLYDQNNCERIYEVISGETNEE